MRGIWLLGVVVVCSLIGGGASPASAQSVGKYDDAAKIYLFRNLEHTFATWRHPTQSTPSELRDWLFATRDRLIRLKKGAESYGSEPVLVSAYDDALKLLDLYERYLRDVILIDLTAGVARANDADFWSRVAVGASVGGSAGFMAGTVFCPVVGNVVGAPVGAFLGVAEGTLRWVVDGREAIEKNMSIDKETRAAKRELIDLLERNIVSTVKGVETQARILAGETKYGWGSRVGFDGSDSLSLEEQLQRRPQDPFVYVMMGVRDASQNPRRAADLFAKAAELVPTDADAGVDFLDLDRAEYFLTAARLAEQAARREFPANRQLASVAVDYHRRACERLSDGGAKVTLHTRLTFARALAMSGQTQKSDAAFERELAELSRYGNERDSVYLRAKVQYDYAAAKAFSGDSARGFELLRQSFQTQPRWQPFSLIDAHTAALRSTDASRLEIVCADPLIGTWTSPDLTMEFYLNGSLRQTSKGGVKLGGYERLNDGQLRLFSNDKNLSFPFTVDRFNLKIGDKYRLNRAKPRLVGRWGFDAESFEFHENGTWTKYKNGATTRGYYTVLAPAPGSNLHELVYGKFEDVLEPTERRYPYQANDSQLTVHVPKLGREFVYSRE